jgi:hypothetical protein
MDAYDLIYLGNMEYEQRLQEAEEIRLALKMSKAQTNQNSPQPPLWKAFWLLFF